VDYDENCFLKIIVFPSQMKKIVYIEHDKSDPHFQILSYAFDLDCNGKGLFWGKGDW